MWLLLFLSLFFLLSSDNVGDSQPLGFATISFRPNGVTTTTKTSPKQEEEEECAAFRAPQGAFVTTSNNWLWQRRPSATRVYNNKDNDNDTKEEEKEEKKTIVVVGGGWAGYTAADALTYMPKAKERVEIILLNAESSPGGLAGGAGSATDSGRYPVEAGLHGFWRHYVNTLQTIQQSIGFSNLTRVMTPYTPSILVSQKGRVALAPVLGNDDDPQSTTNLGDTLRQAAAGGRTSLPSPLDLALLPDLDPLASSGRLSWLDRCSGLGLVGPWLDFLAGRRREDEDNDDEEAWRRYDGLTCRQLFLEIAGVSSALYEELVVPLLAVLPMGTGHDISAAAALSCFHVFGLQSKGCFDVRWCRGTVAQTLFVPWTHKLQQEPRQVQFRFQTRLSSIQPSTTSKNKTTKPLELELQTKDGGKERLHCDAVILAVGGVAMGRLQQASSRDIFAPWTEAGRDFSACRGITCVSVRLFFAPGRFPTTHHIQGGSTQAPPRVAQAMADSPVMVCGPHPLPHAALQNVGFCIYDLQRLHDEFAVSDSSLGSEPDDGPQPRGGGGGGGGVLEVDFFRANEMAHLTNDQEVADLALQAIAAATQTPRLVLSDVKHVGVVRSRHAVSHFFPGASVGSSPRGVRLHPRWWLYACGDWVDRTSGHSSWSTEKAVVTGRQAARAVVQDFWGTQAAQSLPSILPPPGAAPQGGETVPPPQHMLRTLWKQQQEQQRRQRRGAQIPIPPSPWAFARATLKAIGLSRREEES